MGSVERKRKKACVWVGGVEVGGWVGEWVGVRCECGRMGGRDGRGRGCGRLHLESRSEQRVV